MDSFDAMKLFRSVVTELVISMVFTVITSASVVTTGVLTLGTPAVNGMDSARLLVISLSNGLTFSALMAAAAGVSGGHINPCVTLGYVATGRLDIVSGVGYIVSQIIGALLGGGVVKLAYGHIFGLGHSALLPGYSQAKAFMLEAVLTGVLVFVIWGTAVNPKGPKHIAPYMAGIAVTAINLFMQPVTGASMNPARSLGTAVWDGYWKNHWIYWVGPPLGAVVAAVIYEFILMPPRDEHDEENDKMNTV